MGDDGTFWLGCWSILGTIFIGFVLVISPKCTQLDLRKYEVFETCIKIHSTAECSLAMEHRK
jgi:hypothetical protein